MGEAECRLPEEAKEDGAYERSGCSAYDWIDCGACERIDGGERSDCDAYEWTDCGAYEWIDTGEWNDSGTYEIGHGARRRAR